MNWLNVHTIVSLCLCLIGCASDKKDAPAKSRGNLPDQFLVVLGIAQDAGYPQAGCEKDCCAAYHNGKETKKLITSLALIDRTADQYWLFEATPDIAQQLKNLQPYIKTAPDYSPDGILITHAHMGHYTGLMQLGREAAGAKDIPVMVLPRMDSFLRHNGPWSQLVSLNNIRLNTLQADSTMALNAEFTVTPLKVPHRDEYSETAGFIIAGKKRKLLFIPDIDKWEKWEHSITEEIKKADIVLLDGTFYKNGELPGRDMKEIPHPFVEESLQKFSGLTAAEKEKIFFIHFNHTNPLLKQHSPEKEEVIKLGFNVAEEGMMIEL